MDDLFLRPDSITLLFSLRTKFPSDALSLVVATIQANQKVLKLALNWTSRLKLHHLIPVCVLLPNEEISSKLIENPIHLNLFSVYWENH